jgi:hypothetical protein
MNFKLILNITLHLASGTIRQTIVTYWRNVQYRHVNWLVLWMVWGRAYLLDEAMLNRTPCCCTAKLNLQKTNPFLLSEEFQKKNTNFVRFVKPKTEEIHLQ